uniref:Uncharacterized protein n=1 Tax=Pelusios castaneus TaxID=367368 RepID=A0A8C8RZ61_9SAUR
MQGDRHSLIQSLSPDCIDLLDESGTLMNLSEVEDPASELASKYLQERQHYILIKVIRGEGSQSTYYESLLENLGNHHPELAEKFAHLRNHCRAPQPNSEACSRVRKAVLSPAGPPREGITPCRNRPPAVGNHLPETLCWAKVTQLGGVKL